MTQLLLLCPGGLWLWHFFTVSVHVDYIYLLMPGYDGTMLT